MAKKKILVKDLLPMVTGKVSVQSFAYGSFYADSSRDCGDTSEALLEDLRYDILQALVTRVYKDGDWLVIGCEIVHD